MLVPPVTYLAYFTLFHFISVFWLPWVSVAACGLSLVAASKGYSLAAVSGLLIAVAPFVMEQRL